MCQACVSVAEASQAPMLYAAGFAAVGTAGIGWVRRRFGTGDAEPDDTGGSGGHRTEAPDGDEADADGPPTATAGWAPPPDVEHAPVTTTV